MKFEILGIGVDIINMNRISKILEKKYSQKFLEKILSKKELKFFENLEKNEQIFFVNSSWSIKECIVKAT